MFAAASGLAGTVVAVIGSLWRAPQNRFVTTYGSSRWASRKEAERAGLFEPRRGFLRRLKRDSLRPDGPEPVTDVPPPRSGKGHGPATPPPRSRAGPALPPHPKAPKWPTPA